MTPKQRATLVGFAAVLLWSTLALLTTVTTGIPPFQVLALTFAVSGIAGLAFVLRPGGPGLAALRHPPAAAALTIGALFGNYALYFWALKHAPVVEANLINYLWPLLIVVFAAVLGGQRVRPVQWLGTALGLVAAVLLVTRGEALAFDARYSAGFAAAFGSALTWALYSVINQRYSGVPATAIAGNYVVVALLAAAVHAGVESWVAPSPGQWAAMIAIGLGPSGLGFALWDRASKHGDLAVLGTLSYAAPVLSTTWLLVASRTAPQMVHVVAVALLLLGAWLSVRGARSSG